MPQKLNLLTQEIIDKAEPSATPNTPRLVTDGAGLYLQITPSGAKSFLFRFTFKGKPMTMGLGPVHTVTLDEARVKAQKCRSLVANGINPKVEREQEKAAIDPTFRECAPLYIEAHKGEWKNKKHLAQWTQTLETYAYPVIGDMPVREIDQDDVLAVLNPIWKTKTETATRVRARIERVLGWATVKKYRTGANPALWRAYLSELLAKPRKIRKVKHHPAVPHAEIAAFLVGLRSLPDSFPVRAMEFLTMTVGRTSEVIGAKWSEIDLKKKVWAIPAERMKSGRPHWVPLNCRAMEILLAIERVKGADYVFRGTKSGTHMSNMAMLQIMRRMGLKEVPHGMRSTFRDWAADLNNFPREVAEAALAHVVGNQTEVAYLRSDMFEKRKVMMEVWCDYCAAVPSDAGLLQKYKQKVSLKPKKDKGEPKEPVRKRATSAVVI